MPATAVTKGQVLAVVDSPDLTAKLSQEEATLGGLRIDWQRAHAATPSRSCCSCATPSTRRRSTRRPRSANCDRSRKAYELGSYSELQALQGGGCAWKRRSSPSSRPR